MYTKQKFNKNIFKDNSFMKTRLIHNTILRNLIFGGPRSLQQKDSIYLNRDVLLFINSINDLLKSNDIPFVMKIVNINSTSRHHDIVFNSLEKCMYKDANNDFFTKHYLDIKDFKKDECCLAIFSVENNRIPKCLSSILILGRNGDLEIESKTVENEKWTREHASMIIKDDKVEKVSSRLHRPRKFSGIGLNKLLRYAALHIIGITQKMNIEKKDVISLAINPISVYLLQNLIETPKQLHFHFHDDISHPDQDFQSLLSEISALKKMQQKVSFTLIKKIFNFVDEIDIKIPIYETRFLEINQRQLHESLNNVIKKYNNK